MNACATAATVEDWDRSFDTNVKGAFFCYKYAGKQMIAQGRGGRIIGASSGLGKRGIDRTGLINTYFSLANESSAGGFFGAYSASKFAVRGLTQSLGASTLGFLRAMANSSGYIAQELGPHKITVNTYAPGPTDTQMCRLDR